MSTTNAETGRGFGRIEEKADGSHEGTLERLYEGHSPTDVWRAMTDPKRLGEWLAPGTIELRRGGKVHIDFVDSGIVIESEVLEFEDGRLLSYSWSKPGEPTRPLRFSLEAVGRDTRLTLRVGVPAGEDAAKACAGFEGHLDMLGAALEGVPIKFPFQTYLDARKAYTAQLGG